MTDIKEKLKTYSKVARELYNANYSGVSDMIYEAYNSHKSQDDLVEVMCMLRLTYQWKDHISYWDDVAQLTYERLNNADKLMRGLTWSND